MKKFKQIIIVIAFISLFLIAGKNSVKADEYMTGEQIEQVTQGLKDDQYVLIATQLFPGKMEVASSGTVFFGAWIPTRVHVLYPNQEYLSNAFYAKGWRYGEERFKPSWGSGDYLYWQAQGDSGLVEDGYGISVVVNDGGYVAVDSRKGTFFKTYNPRSGSRYKVSNPV